MWLKRTVWAAARFTRLPLRRQYLYAEVCVRLLGAWFLVRGVNFQRWKTQLKQKGTVRPMAELGAADIAYLEDVQHVFRQIKWVGGDGATCLMMVLVARWMLNGKLIPGTIFLGVRRDEKKPGLHAHAWMISTIGVVGYEDVDGFAVVERFGG